MVDALRLSTLQNRRCCRVDKARRTMLGTRHVGRARRIHHAPIMSRTRPLHLALLEPRQQVREVADRRELVGRAPRLV
jgi:hypothetical protein